MVRLMVMALILWRIKTDCLTCNFEIKLEFDTSIESVEQRIKKWMNEKKNKITLNEKATFAQANYDRQRKCAQRRRIENGRPNEFTSLYECECMQFVLCHFSLFVFLLLTFFFLTMVTNNETINNNNNDDGDTTVNKKKQQHTHPTTTITNGNIQTHINKHILLIHTQKIEKKKEERKKLTVNAHTQKIRKLPHRQYVMRHYIIQ